MPPSKLAILIIIKMETVLLHRKVAECKELMKQEWGRLDVYLFKMRMGNHNPNSIDVFKGGVEKFKTRMETVFRRAGLACEDVANANQEIQRSIPVGERRQHALNIINVFKGSLMSAIDDAARSAAQARAVWEVYIDEHRSRLEQGTLVPDEIYPDRGIPLERQPLQFFMNLPNTMSTVNKYIK